MYIIEIVLVVWLWEETNDEEVASLDPGTA